MASILFDAPYFVIALLTIAGATLTWVGMHRLNLNFRNAGLGLLAIAALLLVLRFTVETDEKRVDKQARALMDAISKDDWKTAAGYFKHARMYDWGGDEIADQGKYAAHYWGLTGVKVNSLETKRELDVITATISLTTSHKDQYVSSVPSLWSLEYQKRSKEWVLTHMVPVKIGQQDVANPEEIIRANRGHAVP